MPLGALLEIYSQERLELMRQYLEQQDQTMLRPSQFLAMGAGKDNPGA